jgi:hypothetical protein
MHTEIFAQGIFGNPSNLLNFIKIQNMFNRSLTLIFVMLVCLSVACTKKSTPTPTPPTPPPPPVEVEENILFSLDPDPGTTTATALSGIYSFKVILSSKMPSTGIKIYYLTKTDPGGATTDEKTLSSSLASNEISTGTLASGSLYSVTVTVTSQKTATNTLTKTFKVARK